MKNLILLLFAFLLSCTALEAQRLRLRELIAPAAFSMGAGATWGMHEAISHRWGTVQAKYPKLNPAFWNPKESWKNKYYNRDPEQGRNKTPIWVTDGKHMLASASFLGIFGAGVTVTIGGKKPVWHYLVKAAVSGVFYTAGNYLTYDVIFKP